MSDILNFITPQASGPSPASAIGTSRATAPAAGHPFAAGEEQNSAAARSDFFNLLLDEFAQSTGENAIGVPLQNQAGIAAQAGSLNNSFNAENLLSKAVIQSNGQGLEHIQNANVFGTKSSQNLDQVFSASQGILSEDILARLQALNGDVSVLGGADIQSALGGALTIPASQATIFTDQSPNEGEDIVGGLLGQVNLILQNPELQSTNPGLHSRLTALQNALGGHVGNDSGGLPDGGVLQLAGELNDLLSSGFGALAQNGEISNGNIAYQQLQSGLQSFLNSPPAQLQDFQTQLRPDLLAFLSNQNFGGFQSRGKLFGSFQGVLTGANSNNLNSLSEQLNSLTPGNSEQNNNFLQNVLDRLQSFTQNSGQLGESFAETNLFETPFSGEELDPTPIKQNPLATSTSTLGLQSANGYLTHASQAGASHQASQIIAATLARNAASNGPQQFTLHLNPPDLGRVHVSLELNRDNVLRAKITSEKADTHTLLQKDADSLQRTLEQAGVDLGQDGFEFELADGEQNFDAFLEHQAELNGSNGANSQNKAIEEEIIESHLGIQVDPETGRIHYNILA